MFAQPATIAGDGGSPGLATDLTTQLLHRATATPDYLGWLEHVKAAAGCVRPVRLFGAVEFVEQSTGRIVRHHRTEELPDRVIYKACGNRRAHACPDCAWTYQGDAFQVVRSGLVGGKSAPASIVTHPVVFATFTAPSFGPVHTRAIKRHTCGDRERCDCRPEPCHARRDATTCPHGHMTECFTRHDADDTRLGQPLCLDCYDYEHQAVWNCFSGELWRRTKQAIERHLARRMADPPNTGRTVPPVRVRHGKVAEMQRRGAVHFHVLLRLDGIDPTDPDAVVPPPAEFTIEDLEDAVRSAAWQIHFTTPAHPDQPDGWPITWGAQLDVRRIGDGHEQVTDGRVAGYLAKYATKATEITGHYSNRFTTETIDGYADPDGDHVARLIDACWRLGRPTDTGLDHDGHEQRQRQPDTPPAIIPTPNPYARLRRWAHMLGYGGHFLTKARRYSTTFAALRGERAAYRRAEDHAEEEIPVASLAYVGAGWLSDGDALFANTAARQKREQRRIGREELAHELATAGDAA